MVRPPAVVDGLYQIEGAVNVFLLDDRESGIVVIDTGLPATTRRILEAVESIGRHPSDVRHILITHADIDHIGGLASLVAATGALAYAGTESARHMQNRSTPPHMPVFTRPFIWAMSRLLLKPITVHRTIVDGETLPIAGGIRVIAAPGHTPDNLNFFWERERVLFAADLLNARDGSLALTPPSITWDTRIAHRSAKQVLALNPAYICLGHGSFIDVGKTPEQVENLRQTLG